MSEDMKKKRESLIKQKEMLEQTYQRVLGAIEFADSVIKEEEEPKTGKVSEKKK